MRSLSSTDKLERTYWRVTFVNMNPFLIKFKQLSKNFLLAFVSFLVGLLLVLVISEIAFFVTHEGEWYKDIGLHVKIKEWKNISKDQELISQYDNAALREVVDDTSALQEYINPINFQKKSGVYRILCIGGSTTRGVGTETDQSYPAFLQKIFDDKYPERVEVFNLGLHGATTEDFIERFYKASTYAQFGWKDLNPDLVILAPVWNDLYGAIYFSDKDLLIAKLSWKDFLEHIKNNISSRCALGYYIYKSSIVVYEKKKKYEHDNQIQDVDMFLSELKPAKEIMQKNISKIIELWKKKNAEVYLMVFPGLVKESWTDDFLMNNLQENYSKEDFFSIRFGPFVQAADRKVILAVAKRYKIKCFDLSSLGDNFSEPVRMRLFSDAIHMGPMLNHEIANSLFKNISSNINLNSDM